MPRLLHSCLEPDDSGGWRRLSCSQLSMCLLRHAGKEVTGQKKSKSQQDEQSEFMGMEDG